MKNVVIEALTVRYLEFSISMRISIIVDLLISKLSAVTAHRYWPKKELTGGRET